MTTAVAGNRSGTLRVRVDDAGSLLGLHIDPAELRYGGPSLATAILELYAIARADAIDRRCADSPPDHPRTPDL